MNRLRLLCLAAALPAALGGGVAAHAAHAAGAASAGATAAVTDRSPAWASLTPVQRQTLAPLQRDWATLEPSRKQKWLEVAARFPAMPPGERQRVQERMAEWARMTPAERMQARLQFQEVRQLPAEERQARWQAYQALPDDERKKLALSAKPAAPPKAASAADASGKAHAPTAQDNAKRNLVLPATASTSHAVTPVVMQAKPGATTTTMSVRAAPPPHTQPGLPKIAATPGYVDSATLLPRRGPQGAAARAAEAVPPADQP